jgi:hypothetical protein
MAKTQYRIAIKIKTAPIIENYTALHPFKEEDVKVGNLTDPEKIKAKIEKAKQYYEVEGVETACLSALTGKIRAICIAIAGIQDGKLVSRQTAYCTQADESKLLEDFWSTMVNIEKDMMQPGDTCSIFTWGTFEIPFIYQRSIICGQSSQGCTLFPSMSTYNTFKQNGKASCIDLMALWSCNTRTPVKLWHAAYAMGLIISENQKAFDYSMYHNPAEFYKMFDTAAEEIIAMGFMDQETELILNIANLLV